MSAERLCVCVCVFCDFDAFSRKVDFMHASSDLIQAWLEFRGLYVFKRFTGHAR